MGNVNASRPGGLVSSAGITANVFRTERSAAWLGRRYLHGRYLL
jgi:hypothetical protein